MRFEAGAAYHQQALAAAKRTEGTRAKYARVHRRFAEFVQMDSGRVASLADLNVSTVRRFLLWLGSTPCERPYGGSVQRGPMTLRQHAQILKFLSALLSNDWPEEFPRGDPLARFKLAAVASPPIEVFKKAEVDRLLALCAATLQPLRNVAMLEFFLDTGCRLSEVINLTRPNLELVGANRNGRARIVGKGSKTRYVYFGGRCSKALHRYMATERERTHSRAPEVFLGRSGRKMTKGAVDRLFRLLGQQAGLTNVRCSPHTCRHTFATWYLRQHPGQLEQLRILLGHADLTMVLVYAKLAESDVENVYESVLDDWANISDGSRR